MTDKNPPCQALELPAIYVHAKGCAQATDQQLSALAALGLPLLSRLGGENVQRTVYGYDQPLELLTEISQLYPNRPLIFLRAGLQPELEQIQQLLWLADQACKAPEAQSGSARTDDSQADNSQTNGTQADNIRAIALTILSNAELSVNPFAGLPAPPDSQDLNSREWVSLLAPGQWHTLSRWCDHFVLLPANTIRLLLEQPANGDLMQRLQAIDGRLQLADHLFLPDPSRPLFASVNIAPHESRAPAAFSLLSSRLRRWLDSNGSPESATDHFSARHSANFNPAQPATLHITHSWGGGVAQWLNSFIEKDNGHQHFQLRSENAQSGLGHAQKMSLYFGNQLASPIASWWLQPPIQSVDICNPDYQQIVAEICRRYSISRVFVSSLVGHSLDALTTGLPTMQVLHDHFPVWPLLSISPEPYLRDGQVVDLPLALQQHKKTQEFPDKSAAAWLHTRTAYLDILKQYGIKLAAPGASVLQMQNRLLPAFEKMPVSVIQHALPAMKSAHAVQPRTRKDGRLRMVVLGRMQTGKGSDLLLEALPELTRYVQVYLLGTGKSGEQFFGLPGVDVVLEYQRDELSDILHTMGPDFAALLSVVPETFSFTFSELQQLCIPVIATRVGSFPDRLKQHNNGWLIEPDSDALIAQVAKLCNAPQDIQLVRDRLNAGKVSTTTDLLAADSAAQMVAAYNQLCPPATNIAPFTPGNTSLDADQTAAAEIALGFEKIQNRNLEIKVQQLTTWAQDTARQLKLEEKRRKEWVAMLDAEISRLQMMFETSQLELDEKKNHLQQTLIELQHVVDQNALILGSSSWRMTRPLRVARRAAKNFMLARAWNPARWPWLFSQTVRNLSTLGLKGTIQRLQHTATEAHPQPHSTDQLENVGDPEPPKAFPVYANPDVSIVIPVYNKWLYTAGCLRSLRETPSKYSFEVIVVDDQSSDETAEYLKKTDGIKYLRNTKNLGFVGSCNRGASAARGEYIVMLNNDTQVLDGWLDELIDTFAQEPETGMAGARLIYPDGRLQESGGIIFNDGSGWNYGREQDAERPDYLFLREVDYCSGACIALKTEVFLQLGSFDERYAPAYYEDTDLAFKVREAGLKVYIQPMSAVIHFEGVTAGTDTATGVKKYQLLNQQKFLQRWQEQIQQHPTPIANPDDRAAIHAASDHRLKGRILFIDATTPEPDKDSGSVRLTNLMQCCRDLGYGVTFFADNRDYTGSYTRDLQRAGIEVWYHPWLDSLGEFFRERGTQFDYIFVSRHYIAVNYIALIKRYCPESKFIFDTVDLHYLREQRLAALENSLSLKRAAQRTRQAEMNVIKAADATVVVSTVEKEVLKMDAPGEKVHVLSNIHHVPGRDKGFSERRDIYFVGGYQHPPNVDAACWFVNDIWPLVHAELPDVKFHLIGSNVPQRVRALSGQGVTVHGFVESLDAYLSGCKLAVAPLRYGAGVKGKVNMSMAHGQPVVATPAAVEGMFAEHERELLVAADEASFAREVIRLYQDEALWNRLSDASIKNVEEHFSLSAARSSLVKLFASF